MKPAIAYAVRAMLGRMCDHREKLTSSQLRDCGSSARRLLEFSTSTQPRDRWLVTHALQCVCRTYEDDPAASVSLLRGLITLSNLETHGAEEMFWLASETKRLVSIDPQMVSDVFIAAFGREEESSDATDMIASRIIPMVSNRKQDWESARHILGEDYGDLLRASPVIGTRTLLRVVHSYVEREHRPARDVEVEHFDFRGRPCRMLSDYSAIWDAERQFRVDEPLKMLDAFEAFLLESNPLAVLEPILDQIGELASYAVIWRRLLEVAAQRPESIGRAVKTLAWTPVILRSFDTSKPAGDFISALFPHLSPEERTQVESTILGLAPEGGEEARVIDRLLGCLQYPLLVTADARRRLGALREAASVPPNNPPVQFGEVRSGRFGEEEYLRREGVPIEAEPNRLVRELERPVQKFAGEYANTRPSLTEISSFAQSLGALFESLNNADALGIHRIQAMHAWDALAGAAARAATTADSLDCGEDMGALIKAALVRASEDTEPIHHPDLDAQFDRSPSWSSPAPRIEAAAGLTELAHHAKCVDDEILRRVDALSRDPVPAVRFQVALRLLSLYHTARDFMWLTVRRIASEELSLGVLQGLVAGPLGRLAGPHPDDVIPLTGEIFARVGARESGREVRRTCVSIFTGLYVWQGKENALDALSAIFNDPAAHYDELSNVVTQLRDVLTHGGVTDGEQQQHAVRRRAFALLRRLLDLGLRGLDELKRRGVMDSGATPSERDRMDFKSFGGLVNHIGTEVYFASGAYAAKQAEERQKADPQIRERFYWEAQSILADLADVGYPGLVHHLLETLEKCIPFDSRGVFLLLSRALKAGEQWGYQHESLAVKLFVEIVERYLAESADLLRSDADCRDALVQSLDIFVNAGWPEARRLTYRLDDIYR